MKKNDNRANLFDLDLFSNDRESLLISLATYLKEGQKPLIIFTPNPEQIVQAERMPEFRADLKQADILIPDGVGLVMASRLLALKNRDVAISERIPGVEVVEDLLHIAQEEGYRVLLIGGRDYDPARLPQDNFVWTPGYEDVQQPTTAEEAAIDSILEKEKPAIVFVAFGAPYQERWVVAHRQQLEKNQVKIVMTVGGAFDMLYGDLARAPGWVRSIGLEWAYRLAQEPHRAQRQKRLPLFVSMTWKEFWKK